MAKKLIIVESPAKARTIQKIVGGEFDITSSMGHLVDLPASQLGVDVEHNFEPRYIVIRSRMKLAKQLQQAARGKDAVYLAPDPDREGEAISWHLARLLQEDAVKQAAKKAKASPPAEAPAAPKKSKRPGAAARAIYRITFHEITPQAITAALQRPGHINLKKVDAQQARRVLDRLVGYSLSPLLWKKIGRGLSAGRVQSVALRLIVDREKEVEAFVPQEYWKIAAQLTHPAHDVAFTAWLDKVKGKKAEVSRQADAERIAQELRGQPFVVSDVEEKEQKRYPKPPFTTSTLQQEAFNKLGYSSSRTMRIAQQLYEGLEIGGEGPIGLITYMRTDSVHVAAEALQAVRGFIRRQFEPASLPEAPRHYKSRKTAQEAHEAIRPTSVARTPEEMKSFLTEEQWRLYQLIWQRFVASQMSDARDRVTSVHIVAGPYGLKATGRTSIFAGWTQVYADAEAKARGDDDASTEGAMPPLKAGDRLRLLAVTPSQHFTKPPRRYTDASLVKTLEEAGVGRPSTYAPTIQTIVARDYVRRTSGAFVPTALGRIVTDMLIEHFPEVMDLKFTAQMEEELDRIEDGHLPWVDVVRHFYTPFSQRVTTAQERMREVKREVVPTDYRCEKCGKPMVIRWGRFGQFLSCSGFPDCKNAKPVPTGVACPQPGCGGELVERRGKGRHFYGCSTYPACTYTTRRLPQAESNGDETDSSD